jgi:Bacteriophage lambda head decoration protein D
MPTTYAEGKYAGEFLISEANGTRSREQVTLALGNNLEAGAVVGEITLGAGSSAPGGGNTGNGVMGAITVGASAQVGDYVLTITKAAVDAGDFQVVDPQGDVIGVGTVGVAFSGGGISFTLADGAADFVVGDTFTITVAGGSGKYAELDPAAADGSQAAAGVLYAPVDATAADAAAVIIVRDAEVSADDLGWKAGMTAGQIITATDELAALDIIARA